MKNWIKNNSKVSSKNLKAIGVGFLWAIGAAMLAGAIGVTPQGPAIFVWIFMSYRYQKKFAKNQ